MSDGVWGRKPEVHSTPELYGTRCDNRHILFRHFSVKCKSCKVIIGNVIHGETDFFDTPEQAAAAWNRRPCMPNTSTQRGWWLN